MNGNKGTKILSEIYSKCLNQAKDVESEISKIINNKYPVNTIDRIKEKILEKLDNFSTSITNLLISINTSEISLNEKEIWKRKQENLLISQKNLNKRLEDCIYSIKKKYYEKNGNYKSDFKKNIELGKNINLLQQEKET